MPNVEDTSRETADPAPPHDHAGELQLIRGILGGALMGLANLVPGISGGTMLLATGVYPQFIGGIAELSTFRFRVRVMLMLGAIVFAALLAIVLLAGPVSALVVERRWIMYSLFIGLTLGGVPILWRMLRPAGSLVVVMTTIGIVVMAAMALIKPAGAAGGAEGHQYIALFIAGIVGASAMVLPGVSGGYMLLILGQYVTILSAIAVFKDGVQGGDWNLAAQSLHVVIPVGIGVLIGVVGISNLIKLLLAKYERATLGVLLGLLLGAVIGIWPFQEGVAPAVGSTFRGDVVTEVDGELVMEKTGKPIDAKDFDTEFFTPTVGQIFASLGLVVVGFGVSVGVSRLGGNGKKGRKAETSKS